MAYFKTGDRVRITAPNLNEGVFDGTLGTYVGRGDIFHHVKPDIWPDTDYECFGTRELTKIEEENNMTKINLSTGPANEDEDAVRDLAVQFAKVRADERAKLQDRIEELEKNLSYEVEQKIKLADTLRDERAKRPDRAALERIAAECEADIPYDDGNETAKLIGKRIREALALEPEAREEQGRVEWGVAYRQNDGKLFVDEAVDYEDAVFCVANSSVYDMVVQRRVSAYAPVGEAPAPEAREIPDAEVAAAYSAFVQASFGFPGAPAMRAALEASRDVSGA